jgi:hypothetical protein
LTFLLYTPSCSSVTQGLLYIDVMVNQRLLLALLTAYLASAVPLNINLGAYSPALVVGDGSIEFGNSPERASQVLQTLASGAENGAVPAGQTSRTGQQANGQGTTINPPPQVVSASPAVASTSTLPSVVGAPAPAASGPGITSPLVSAEAENAQGAAFDPSNPMPAEFISHKFDGPINPVPKYPNMAKEKKTVLGKRAEPAAQIEKRSEPYTVKADFQITENDTPAEPESEIARRIKRDIDGFREALTFARDAQKNQPKVVLDAGITVFPGSAIPVNSAANGALPPTTGNGAQPAKREIVSESKRGDKLGMTLIAISEV